jgi:hypothetical protein
MVRAAGPAGSCRRVPGVRAWGGYANEAFNFVVIRLQLFVAHGPVLALAENRAVCAESSGRGGRGVWAV